MANRKQCPCGGTCRKCRKREINRNSYKRYSGRISRVNAIRKRERKLADVKSSQEHTDEELDAGALRWLEAQGYLG